MAARFLCDRWDGSNRRRITIQDWPRVWCILTQPLFTPMMASLGLVVLPLLPLLCAAAASTGSFLGRRRTSPGPISEERRPPPPDFQAIVFSCTGRRSA